MSIADNLTTIAENVPKVYEAGKQAQYDAFWDAFQNYGNRTGYNTAFGYAFPEKAYNPKYDLQGVLRSAFVQNSSIKDAKVRLLNVTDMTQLVRYNSTITRIPELNISESTTLGSDSPFLGASKLSDITLTGVLAKSLSFSSCPLTVESMKSIISCLKDYSGTENEGVYSVTFSSNCKSKLDAEGNTSPNGNTWREYASDLGWVC